MRHKSAISLGRHNICSRDERDAGRARRHRIHVPPFGADPLPCQRRPDGHPSSVIVRIGRRIFLFCCFLPAIDSVLTDSGQLPDRIAKLGRNGFAVTADYRPAGTCWLELVEMRTRRRLLV